MSEGFKATDEGTYLCAGEATDWRGLHDAIGRVSAAVNAELSALAITRTGPSALSYRFENDPGLQRTKLALFGSEPVCAKGLRASW